VLLLLGQCVTTGSKKIYFFVSLPLIYGLNDACEMQMYFIDADVSLNIMFIYCIM
jgi:hypothetical protein